MATEEKADRFGRPRWPARFLAELRAVPDVSAACRAAKIARPAAYRFRQRNPAFRQAWDDAIEASVDGLVAVAFQRARDISDVLLIFLLKAHRPEIYRDTVRVDLYTKARELAGEYGLTEEEAVAEAEKILHGA